MTNSEMLKATSGHDAYNEPVYIDTETTGLNPQGDEIIEIAIVEENGTVLLDTFVKPVHVSQWPEAQAINHISPQMVQNAPSLADISADIQRHTQGRKVYMWNAQFDAAFLTGLLDDAEVICAMNEYANYIEQTQPQNISRTGRYKLEYTANDLGVQIIGDPHRAKTDVLTMINIRKTYLADTFNRTDLNGSVNVEPYK